MDHPLIDDPVDAELRLVDVIARHSLRRVPLDVTDFTGRRQDYWRAITRIWDTDTAPTVETIHAELVLDGVHTRPVDALDIACLPQGFRAQLDDYVTVIRKRRLTRDLTLLFVDGARLLADGADPHVILARVRGLADG